MSYRHFLTQPSSWAGTLCKEGLLRPLSWGYGLGIALRNVAFDKGWLAVDRPTAPYIVSIGNVAAGGTGKTPLTLLLAETFTATTRIAIVTRGYRAALASRRPLAISLGAGARFSAAGAGDEPYLLAERLPGTLVIVGRDRVAAARYAAQLGAELILLDDGFQHRWLGRDSDVVVIDGSAPPALQELLPRGLLREGLAALQRAHLIVINHIRDDKHYTYVKDALSRYTAAPCVGMAMEVVQICSSHVTLDRSLEGKRVALFCGIANPASFVQTVNELGAIIVAQRCFGDHASFKGDALLHFAREAQAQGAESLVCTEKDAVKVRALAAILPLPLLWPTIRLRLVAGQTHWQHWCADIQHHLQQRVEDNASLNT